MSFARPQGYAGARGPTGLPGDVISADVSVGVRDTGELRSASYGVEIKAGTTTYPVKARGEEGEIVFLS